MHPAMFRAILSSLLVSVAWGAILDSDQLSAEGTPGERTQSSSLRRYEQGPLKIDEFRGKTVDGSDMSAYTATRIRYRFDYSVHRRQGSAVATLSSLDVFTTFEPNDSWWSPNTPTFVLDHEQGHFDVAEINARRLRLAIEKSRVAGKEISATGHSISDATKSLSTSVEKIVRAVDRQNDQDNVDYDRRTRHGINRRIQREQRRIQQMTLQQLRKQLDEIAPAAKRRSANDRSAGAFSKRER